MGLDVGDRWIGVALSDPGGVLATPLTIIDRTIRKDDLEAILEIASERNVARVVVGLPRAMDGTIREQAEKVQEFVRRLSRKTAVPIEFRDERLSTVSAGRLMQESGGKRQRKKIRDDAAAAAVILQSYLDEMRQRAEDSEGSGT
jgi:putative Holliday junction resolvase